MDAGITTLLTVLINTRLKMSDWNFQGNYHGYFLSVLLAWMRLTIGIVDSGVSLNYISSLGPATAPVYASMATESALPVRSHRTKKDLVSPGAKDLIPSQKTPRSSDVDPRANPIYRSDDENMVFYKSGSSGQDDSGLLTPSDILFTDRDGNDIFSYKNSSESPNVDSLNHDEKTSILGTALTSPAKLNPRHSQISRVSSESDSLSEFTGAALQKSPLSANLTPAERASLTRPQMVTKEILFSERAYVNDLREVIEGYLYHLFHHGMTGIDIETIFGNLEDIYDFNKGVLDDLENVGAEPDKVAQIFVNKVDGFNSLYVQYCTNYPEASSFLAEILKDKEIADFFQERQRLIGHTLPIFSYLMKPVQRIMKYHLLFKDMAKHTKETDPGYDIIMTAVAAMTDVAEYINEMKRLQEDAIKVQDILSNIIDLEGLDVFATGRLVLESSFRIHGARGERQLFLFEKLLLICKAHGDGLYQFRDGITCNNMMLVESIGKEPLCFQVIRFDSQKVNYTIQAKNAEMKKEWTRQLKRLILENHPALIPSTARDAILGPNNNELPRSKYYSMPLQVLDDTGLGNKINLRKQKAYPGKENKEKEKTTLIGSKRESVSKDDSTGTAKKSSILNSKAKDFLEKKSKPGPPSPGEKAEKSKQGWKFKRNKQRKSNHEAFDDLSGDRESVSPDHDDLMVPTNLVKSRSLESLRDAIESSEDLKIVEPDEEPVDDKSQKANEQIKRLSLLHDLISLDVQDERNTADEAETKTNNSSSQNDLDDIPMDTVQRRTIDFERRQLSKSTCFDSLDNSEICEDLMRSRPVSLPPDSDLEEEEKLSNSNLEETRKRFEGKGTVLATACDELRKYGLTRTRSFNRKNKPAGYLSENLMSESTSSLASTTTEDLIIPKPVSDDEQEKIDKLEKRLSLISDEDSTTTSIKNTIRKVSQAFSTHTADQSLESPIRNSGSFTNSNVDLGTFLFSEPRKSAVMDKSNRHSLGAMIAQQLSQTTRPSSEASLSKQRAFSTTVINEVSFETPDEELLREISESDATDLSRLDEPFDVKTLTETFESNTPFEKKPSFEKSPSLEKSLHVQKSSSFEKSPSFEKKTSFEEKTPVEEIPSFVKNPSYERRQSIERKLSFEHKESIESSNNLDANTTFDTGTIFETSMALEPNGTCEPSKTFEQVKTFERVETFERSKRFTLSDTFMVNSISDEQKVVKRQRSIEELSSNGSDKDSKPKISVRDLIKSYSARAELEKAQTFEGSPSHRRTSSTVSHTSSEGGFSEEISIASVETAPASLSYAREVRDRSDSEIFGSETDRSSVFSQESSVFEDDADSRSEASVPRKPLITAAGSVRRYRIEKQSSSEKSQVKSVYDRIKEYTSLANKDRTNNVRPRKSLENMPETLDNSSTGSSLLQRHRCSPRASQVSTLTFPERERSVPINTDIHFNIRTDGTVTVTTKPRSPSPVTVTVRGNDSVSRQRKAQTIGPSAKYVDTNGFDEWERNNSYRDYSVLDWRNNKSATIDERKLRAAERLRQLLPGRTAAMSNGQRNIFVRHRIQQYNETVVEPGKIETEKHLELHRRLSDSKKNNRNSQRIERKISQKKKEKELRERKQKQVDEEAFTPKRNPERRASFDEKTYLASAHIDMQKLTRSQSCESVQHGFVKQLIGVFDH